MILLKADHRVLTRNAEHSYLTTNYSSGVTALVVVNAEGFSADDYLLLGEWGSETSEIVQIDSISTNTVTIKVATKFSHSESTKVSVIRYNQVKFYQTAAPTFSHSENPLGTENIEADDLFTAYQDTTNTTGYGWFVFYNSTTTKATQNSNAIPYADFAINSVNEIFANFFSTLNNKEMKLITNKDAYRWLNEAYTIAVNELNLVNNNFEVKDGDDITTVAGTQEYDLEDDFSKVISVYDNSKESYIKPMAISSVESLDDNGNAILSYYIRGGSVIGFSPVPTDVRTITVRYKAKAATLSTPYDNVVLPNGNFYCLIDYMIYKASPKLKRPDGAIFYKSFMEGISRMKVTSHKQDGSIDSFTVDHYSNI